MEITVKTNIIAKDFEIQLCQWDLFEEYTEPQQTWCDAVVQCLVKSTWNGVGCALYSLAQLAFEVGVFAVSLIMCFCGAIANLYDAIKNCCYAKQLTVEGKDLFAEGREMAKHYAIVIPTQFKNFLYHMIRAVPIVGYPLSQAIHYVADELYRVSYVQDDLQYCKDVIIHD